MMEVRIAGERRKKREEMSDERLTARCKAASPCPSRDFVPARASFEFKDEHGDDASKPASIQVSVVRASTPHLDASDRLSLVRYARSLVRVVVILTSARTERRPISPFAAVDSL